MGPFLMIRCRVLNFKICTGTGLINNVSLNDTGTGTKRSKLRLKNKKIK
jgi:hypothetical protein